MSSHGNSRRDLMKNKICVNRFIAYVNGEKIFFSTYLLIRSLSRKEIKLNLSSSIKFSATVFSSSSQVPPEKKM
jgi:hypothetical protein